MKPTIGKTYEIEDADTPMTIVSPYGAPDDRMWVGAYTEGRYSDVEYVREDSILCEVAAVAHLDVHLVPGTDPGTYQARVVARGEDVPGSLGKTECMVAARVPKPAKSRRKR